MIWIIGFFFFSFINGYKFQLHPFEKRIAYISNLKNLDLINPDILQDFICLLDSHPLLIFKGMHNISPQSFLDFAKLFDKYRDEEAIQNPDKYPHQMLQPFDQFPECKHVAPRGNVELQNYYNIKNLIIKPQDHFIDKYVWHSDMLGHEYKLSNVITAFYVLQQPLIGGDTDFISGETIYEKLSLEEQKASKNMLIEINRRKFVMNKLETDYAGVNRLEHFNEMEEGNTQIPLVYAPDSIFEKPRVLLMPTFFERVVGWSISDSRNWIQKFMNEKVLPHRISIQWKKGDLAIFNNRRFIHSSTPARNYLDNSDSSSRLLLQTFIPTKKPILSFYPRKIDVYSCYNVGWIKDQETSIISAHNKIKFAEQQAKKNNESITDNVYVFKK